MPLIFKIAYRNIWRNSRRTALTAVTVMAVVMVLIFMQCYLTGILGNMLDLAARFTTGHVKIYPEGYADKEALMPLDLALYDSSKLVQRVKRCVGVEAAGRRIKFLTMAQRGERDEFPLLMGIEPEAERHILQADKSVVKGRYFGTDPREAIIGWGLARKLGIVEGEADVFEPGSAKIQILAPRGIPMTFTVVGVFRFGYSLMDDKTMLVKFEDAQYAADMDADDMATEIIIMLRDRNDSIAAAGVIKKDAGSAGMGDGIEVLPWQSQGFLYQMIQTMYAAIMVIGGVLFLISASTIVNTMLMSVMERTREIGMLMSMGMKGREIMAMVLAESVSIGVVGGLAGVVLGAAISYVLSLTGIPIGDLSSQMPVPIGETLQVEFVWKSLPLAFCFGLFMSALASLWPARKAAILSPTEALRTL